MTALRRILLSCVLLLSLTGCVTETTGPNKPTPDPEKQLQALIDLGIGYIRNGEHARAKDNLTRALELDPDSAAVHNGFGLVFQVEGETRLAESHFKQAVSSDPNFTQARNNYGAFLFERGRFEEAVEQLGVAADDRFYPNRPQVFENLGVSYLQLNQLDDAEQAFLRASQLNPKQTRALLELAEIRYRQKNYAESRDYYQRLTRSTGASSRSLWLCIRLARVFGTSDQEASCSLMLRNVFPNTAEHRAYLATVAP